MKRLLNLEINFMKAKDTNMEEKVYRQQDYIPGMKLKTDRALIKLKSEDFWRDAHWSKIECLWIDNGYYHKVYEEEMVEKIMFVD